ncbi:MAG: isoprenylcysteine carboxylmethyltransferase family protein [Acidobacteriota bacterium]
MTNVDRGPGVRFPPPFIFVAGFLLAWLLQTRLPFDIDGAGTGQAQSILGVTLLAGGLGLMASGLVTFARSRTAVIPNRPARTLVRSGPYRFTRNPMYVGLTMGYVGVALLMNWVWPLILLPVVLMVLTAAVIRREEAHLRSAFGSQFDDYARRVRRWL